uniref:Uncharacterized protein n=1 Tax=Pararge aegeria TaxID=116150 RepID=S4PB50_9NEOP
MISLSHNRIAASPTTHKYLFFCPSLSHNGHITTKRPVDPSMQERKKNLIFLLLNHCLRSQYFFFCLTITYV